ncbi:zinc carboxypeptidase, partial [Streptomyces lydicus]
MRPRLRGGRTTALAALLSLALAAPIAAAQAQPAPPGGPATGTAGDTGRPHQYEVSGPATPAARTALAAT